MPPAEVDGRDARRGFLSTEAKGAGVRKRRRRPSPLAPLGGRICETLRQTTAQIQRARVSSSARLERMTGCGDPPFAGPLEAVTRTRRILQPRP